MSPRGLLAAFSRFSRPARRQDGQARHARQRRTARPATRAPHLAAELLESRCMLSATARLENNISMFDRISVSHPSMRLPANPGGSFVGQFFWNGSGFNSFCVEIGQSISPGLHTFPTVTSLSASGVANAGLVEQFWRSYGPTALSGFTRVTDAAAFQLGIWELISDGASRNLKSGSFNVGGSASPAVALAESWLNGTGAPAPGAGGSVALHVMQHPTLQDQVIWGPLPPPSVSVKVTPTTGVTEDGPNALTYEFTASPAPTADITVNYQIGGSATAGSDFTTVLPPGATTGTITIRAGSTSPVTLRIVPKADTLIEPDETVVITLQNGTGYALGTSVATGTITNDDLPAVTLAVSHAGVMEDGTTNLVYTFTRTGPPTSRLTVNYGITGTADGADYSGATPGTGKTISFLAGSDKATVTIDPTPDTEIEFNETVILTLASGSGYTFDTTRPPATGTIENDDYRLDLILDGLPEESAPPPNELSPGAELPIGGGRTRLDIVVQSPGNAGTVTLTVLSGADKITLWDAEEGGQQVQPGVWPVGQHPRTLWVEDTGLEGDFQLVAMFQNKGVTTDDASKGKVVGAEWRTAWADPNGNQNGTNRITPKVESLTYEVDVDLETGDPAGVRPPGGPDDKAVKGTAERLNKWVDAFAAQAGLGVDKKTEEQFVGLFNPDPNEEKLPKQARTFITTGFDGRPKDADYQHIGNAMRENQMRNNIWRIEFVPVVAPWEWNATITLPEWKQFTTDADRLNPDVQKQWENFIDALAGHEKIHKEKWEQYVRLYQSRVDVFAKTRFFGEAADPKNERAKTSAWNDAKRLFDAELKKLQADLNALTDGYNVDVERYDDKSKHGKTQTGYDRAGQNVKAVDPGHKLLRE